MQPQPTDDDIYVNVGVDDDIAENGAYYPKPPEEQTTEINQAEAIKASSYPVLGAISDWFEEQIKNAPNIDNILMDAQTFNGVLYDRKTSIEGQALAFQLLKGLMQDKYDEFKEFKNEQ